MFPGAEDDRTYRVSPLAQVPAEVVNDTARDFVTQIFEIALAA